MRPLDVGNPSVSLSAGQVVQVVPVPIGLALERDVHIGLVGVAILQQTHRPFEDVEKIERHPQQFLLLRGVYAFVIDYIRVNPTGVARPERAEKVQTDAFGHEFAADNHRFTHRQRGSVGRHGDGRRRISGQR